MQTADELDGFAGAPVNDIIWKSEPDTNSNEIDEISNNRPNSEDVPQVGMIEDQSKFNPEVIGASDNDGGNDDVFLKLEVYGPDEEYRERSSNTRSVDCDDERFMDSVECLFSHADGNLSNDGLKAKQHCKY